MQQKSAESDIHIQYCSFRFLGFIFQFVIQTYGQFNMCVEIEKLLHIAIGNQIGSQIHYEILGYASATICLLILLQ